MHLTTEIPRSDWTTYLAWLTEQLPGTDGTIEAIGEEIGDQMEVASLPVRRLSYDVSEDAIDITLGGPGTCLPVPLHHFDLHPQHLWVDVQDGMPVALMIERADGDRTLLRLTPEPALGT